MTNRKTVLVVDDEEPIRALLSMILKKDFDVVVASNGMEAIHSYNRYAQDITLVVTDFQMPHVKGDELIEWLRQQNAVLPILLVTGDECRGEMKTLLDTFRVFLMQKPFKVSQVLEVVRELAA